MKKPNRKKGFTIVELVIVIAVVGVLTAVLVPTFVNLANQAKRAENQTFVKNLNTQMAIREATEGKNKTMYEAMMEAEDIGFNVEKLTPYDGNDIVWDSVANRFAIVDKDGKEVYSDGGIKAEKKTDLWKIYANMPETQTYSIYAKEGWDMSVLNEAVFKVGFDPGKNSTANRTVKYDRAEYFVASARETLSGKSPRMVAEDSREVRIRTTGGELKIGSATSNAKGEIRHYGTLDGSTAYLADGFVTHGVVQNMDLKAGKAIAGSNGVLYLNKAEAGTEAAEEDDGVVIIPSFATSDDIKAISLPAGYVVTETGTTQPANIASKIAANQGLMGSGTEADPFQVYNRETMQAISMLYTSGYKYFKVNKALTENGKIDCKNWVPVRLQGSFNGNGVEFINADKHLFAAITAVSTDGSSYSGNAGFYDGSAESFNNAPEIVIENFTVNSEIKGSNAAAAIAHSVGTNITFKNIDIKGYIEGYVASGIANYGAYQFGDTLARNPEYTQFKSNLNFENCNISATLVALNEGAAGLIQHPHCAAGSVWKVDGCTISSEMYATKSSNNNSRTFVYNYQSSDKISVIVDGTKVTSGVHYTGEKAHDLVVDSPALSAPATKGSTFSIQAADNAGYAIYSLIISPNPGSMTATYLEERVELKNGSFNSNLIKYSDVKVNSEKGAASYNADSTVFNVYSAAFDGTSNGQYIQVVQYASDGSIISISQCKLALVA